MNFKEKQTHLFIDYLVHLNSLSSSTGSSSNSSLESSLFTFRFLSDPKHYSQLYISVIVMTKRTFYTNLFSIHTLKNTQMYYLNLRSINQQREAKH